MDGMVIGAIGLFEIDFDARSCEIGYSLGSRWWGKGYGTEAALAVKDFAFKQMGIHRIQGTCHPENSASENILKKIGMQFEGIMREAQRNRDGTYSDLKLYAVLSDE